MRGHKCPETEHLRQLGFCNGTREVATGLVRKGNHQACKEFCLQHLNPVLQEINISLVAINKHSYLTSRQLQFLDLLKNFVLEKGEISKRNLIESPFTMIHPEGIRGILNTKEIDEIIELTNKVLAA